MSNFERFKQGKQVEVRGEGRSFQAHFSKRKGIPKYYMDTI